LYTGRQHALVLLLEAFHQALAGMVVPALYEVELVGRHHEGRLVLLEYVQRLYGLRLEAFDDVHDQHGEVGQRPAPCAKCGERLVTRRVYEEQAGDLELAAGDEGAAALAYVGKRYLAGADVLGYAARLARGDIRAAAYGVEQGGLAVVDMAQNADDGLADLSHAITRPAPCPGPHRFRDGSLLLEALRPARVARDAPELEQVALALAGAEVEDGPVLLHVHLARAGLYLVTAERAQPSFDHLHITLWSACVPRAPFP
jgi:hypothetical protein